MTAPSAGIFPERIGRYELLLPLGAGGMATVYLARSEAANGFARMVALKLVHAHLRTEPELVQSFVDEAKLAALIHHPNVVVVIDAGDDPAGPFLVMDYIEGDSLRALQKRGAIPAPIALRILDDALAGLHAAHELKNSAGASLGLVHRDFSPHNIIVGVDGLARLLDFGVAKALGRDVRTSTGMIKGKVRYMPPEQVRGEALDRRCDVWAAGVVAWEIFAGRRLHAESEDDIAVAMRIVQQPMPSLGDVRPDLPVAIADAISWALAARPADRCPSAAELRRSLARAAEQVGGLASPAEVGDFVMNSAAEILAERSRLAEAVREERRQRGKAVTPPSTSTQALTTATVSEVANEATQTASSLDTGTTERRTRTRTRIAQGSAVLAAMAVAAIVATLVAQRRPDPAVNSLGAPSSNAPAVATASEESRAITAPAPEPTTPLEAASAESRTSTPAPASSTPSTPSTDGTSPTLPERGRNQKTRRPTRAPTSAPPGAPPLIKNPYH
jgi:serine/threonine-protein kinase